MADLVVTTIRVSEGFVQANLEPLDLNEPSQSGFTDGQGLVTLLAGGNCTGSGSGKVCDYVVRYHPSHPQAYLHVASQIIGKLESIDKDHFGNNIRDLRDERPQRTPQAGQKEAAPTTKAVWLENGNAVAVDNETLEGIIRRSVDQNGERLLPPGTPTNVIQIIMGQGMAQIEVSADDYETIEDYTSGGGAASYIPWAIAAIATVAVGVTWFRGRGTAESLRNERGLTGTLANEIVEVGKDVEAEATGTPRANRPTVANQLRTTPAGGTGNLRSMAEGIVERRAAEAAAEASAASEASAAKEKRTEIDELKRQGLTELSADIRTLEGKPSLTSAEQATLDLKRTAKKELVNQFSTKHPTLDKIYKGTLVLGGLIIAGWAVQKVLGMFGITMMPEPGAQPKAPAEAAP